MEKQEAVHDKKEKRKVTALPFSYFYWLMEIIPTVLCPNEGSHGLFLNWKVQARLSEIQKALKETKAVQEMKEQVLLLIHLLQTLCISFKPHSSSHERHFFQATG